MRVESWSATSCPASWGLQRAPGQLPAALSHSHTPKPPQPPPTPAHPHAHTPTPAPCRTEYEIAARYETLSTLLTAATDVAKFTLELRQHGRAMRAENWIIGLISFEILLSMWHIWMQHAGMA